MIVLKQMATVVAATMMMLVAPAWSQSMPVAAVSRIAAMPMHSKTPQQRFPRVRGLPDAAIQLSVNRVLANREKDDAAMRRDCLRSEKFPGKDADAYNEWIRVRYLSPRFLSIEVRESDFGCNAYPNLNIPYPITVDLKTGKEVDWDRFFTPGFLPPEMGGQSRLGQLYLQRSGLPAHDECRAAIEKYGYTIWLDSAKQSMMTEPDLPHVVRVCAVTIAIPFAEVVPFIADRSVRLDNAKR